MPSQDTFIGSMVSIDCGTLGSYQGHVKKIDPEMNTLTISHAFHNGLRCDEPQINLSSTTIKEIKIIHSPLEAKEIIDRKVTPSKMTKEIDDVTKPTCISPVKIIKAASSMGTKSGTTAADNFSSASTGGGTMPSAAGPSKAGGLMHSKGCRRKLSPPDSPSKFMESSGTTTLGPRRRMSNSATRDTSSNNNDAPPDSNSNINITSNAQYGNSNRGGMKPHSRGGGMMHNSNFAKQESSPRKIDNRGGRRGGANSKNSECFSAPVDTYLQEFDFESNLKLFNKKAVFQEIENSFPDLSLESDPREEKYRHDENILQPGENNSNVNEMKQQIKVPETKSQLYYTDNGLVVPSISLELRDKVCQAAANAGLTFPRQSESFGRAASEIIMHLIGGSHRIQPKNDHQMPVVVFLCGAHEQGGLGVCTARILACHNVQVIVLMPNLGNIPEPVTKEMELYRMCGGILIHNVKRLPTTIDLIVSALDSPHHPTLSLQSWYQAILNWNITSDIRSPILALDPPPQGPGLQSKWSLCKVLPLYQSSTKCGSLYLCDLSIPTAIFTQVDIKYISPFGAKFAIPLHKSQ